MIVLFYLCCQPRNDMLPCLDVIKEYLGLIFTFADVVQIHKGASSKVHDCDKMKEEGRIDVSQSVVGFSPSLQSMLRVHNYDIIESSYLCILLFAYAMHKYKEREWYFLLLIRFCHLDD